MTTAGIPDDKRAAKTSEKTSNARHLRIFLSSPGDVGEERNHALEVIEALQDDPMLIGQVTLESIAWDKKGAGVPMLATLAPQEAINQGLPKPSDCDIVVVIFWSRMGTPLPPEYTTATGERYLSGTAWEYDDAVQASRLTGKPLVLVYRRMEEPVIGMRDPARVEKITQFERVEEFFAGFTNADGSLRQGYQQYDAPSDFRDQFAAHLRNLVVRLLGIDTGNSVEDQRLLAQAKFAAEEWANHDRNPTYLWTHERLQKIYPILERSNITLDALTQEFLRPEHQRLLDEIADPKTTHVRRVTIGDRLAVIGDPRDGVGLRPDGVPDVVWCSSPGGTVTLRWGSGKPDSGNFKEAPFDCGPFQISKYLITAEQYRAFVEAPDGFRENRWWFGLGLRPPTPGVQAFTAPNRPADNVSWYDAVAFCRWMSARLGVEIRLPYEQEWQFAASHGESERLYPWGEKWIKTNANIEPYSVGQTTAVGMYPHGSALCGACDLIGNVWEWCINADSDPHKVDLEGTFYRVVRGAAWATGKHKATVFYRGGDTPTQRRNTIGFRVVQA